MSNGTDRKSMDDVLASIRRIVRAEKEPDAEPAPGGTPQAGARSGGGNEPLALTPDMRSDRGMEPEAISRPAGLGLAFASAPAQESPAAPDRETLRAMVREILVEELTSGDADGAVRGIIRDELMHGEIGRNISQNVLNLIQAEIAKSAENR